ncbi:MAG: RNA-binding protein [Alphaproteobacteria bacterium]|nr:RNA-binding protein [Alphaproteobacteria bacterium]
MTIGRDREPEASGPQRRCVATGASFDRSGLLRFVVGPSGELVPDVACGLPGRGLWLTPRRELFERAIAKRLFARAARRPVSVPPELADRIEALLAERCRETIGLARRAGLAVAGFAKVSEALRAGKVGLLLAALDGAEGGRGKIRAVGRDLPLAVVLTATELGAVFGRDNVVHVALGGGRLARRLIVDAEKLAGFRPDAVVDRGAEPAAPRTVRHEGGIGPK